MGVIMEFCCIVLEYLFSRIPLDGYFCSVSLQSSVNENDQYLTFFSSIKASENFKLAYSTNSTRVGDDLHANKDVSY